MSEDIHRNHREQLAPYLLGALTPTELADLEHHVEGCAECQAELRWLNPAAEILPTEIDQVEVPSRMRSSVMAAVAEEVEREAAEARSPEDEAERRRPAWFRLPDFGTSPALAGAFALILVVLVAGVGGYVLNSSGGGSGESSVIAGTSTNGSDAVLVSDGGAGTLQISELDRPGQGDVYQAWIQRGKRIEPTDSLFLPRADGTATAAIPDLEGVTAVLVSTEPEGGSASPTTTPVITVPVSS